MLPGALSPLLILLAVAIYGVVHSWLASIQAKALARRIFGRLAERTYRLAYNGFAVVSLLPVLALPAILPDQPLYTIPFPWVLLTIVLQVLAILALFIGLLQTGLWSFLGLEQLFVLTKSQPPQLVVRGLYRWVRHPLYTAGLVFIWLTPVMTANLLVLYASLSLYLVVGAYFEERKLIREFGEAYLRYRQTTPMLVPRPPNRTTHATQPTHPSA
jgi:protein-S-isoprenylcysteine O-methyltransferase Ste14